MEESFLSNTDKFSSLRMLKEVEMEPIMLETWIWIKSQSQSLTDPNDDIQIIDGMMSSSGHSQN